MCAALQSTEATAASQLADAHFTGAAQRGAVPPLPPMQGGDVGAPALPWWKDPRVLNLSETALNLRVLHPRPDDPQAAYFRLRGNMIFRLMQPLADRGAPVPNSRQEAQQWLDNGNPRESDFGHLDWRHICCFHVHGVAYRDGGPEEDGSSPSLGRQMKLAIKETNANASGAVIAVGIEAEPTNAVDAFAKKVQLGERHVGYVPTSATADVPTTGDSFVNQTWLLAAESFYEPQQYMGNTRSPYMVVLVLPL